MPCPPSWPYCSEACLAWDYVPPGPLTDVFHILEDRSRNPRGKPVPGMERPALDKALRDLGLLAEESLFTRLPPHLRHKAANPPVAPAPRVCCPAAKCQVAGAAVPRRTRQGPAKHGSRQRVPRIRPAPATRSNPSYDDDDDDVDSDDDDSGGSDVEDNGDPSPGSTHQLGAFLTASVWGNLGVPSDLAGGSEPEKASSSPLTASAPTVGQWPALKADRPAKSRAPKGRWVTDSECPVCARRFPMAQLEAHVERCLTAAARRPNPRPPRQECPVCGLSFDPAAIESHVDGCIANQRPPSPKSPTVACPFGCGAEFSVSAMDRHLDECPTQADAPERTLSTNGSKSSWLTLCTKSSV